MCESAHRALNKAQATHTNSDFCFPADLPDTHTRESREQSAGLCAHWQPLALSTSGHSAQLSGLVGAGLTGAAPSHGTYMMQATCDVPDKDNGNPGGTLGSDLSPRGKAWALQRFSKTKRSHMLKIKLLFLFSFFFNAYSSKGNCYFR